MGGKKRFSYESIEDIESIGKYLEAVRQGLVDGSMNFTYQGQSIILEPQGLLDFALEASSKGKSHSLKLKLKWKERLPVEQEQPQPLSIHTGSRKA